MRIRSRNRQWRLRRAGQVFVLTSLLVLLAAWNTGMNLFYILVGGLGSFLLLSLFFSMWNLRGLVVVRDAPAAVYRGATLGVTVRLENRARFLSSISVHIESAARPGVPMGYVFKLPPRQAAVMRMAEEFHKRGPTPLPPIELVTSFPFGLIETRSRCEDGAEVLVYPRVFAVRSAVLDSARGAGDAPRMTRGAGDEFFSLRAYLPGDDLRHIAWRASARKDELIVKELSQETSRFVVCVFDGRRRDDMPDFERRFEDMIELIASLGVTLLNRQFGLAVITAQGFLPRGEGQAHSLKLLDMLARIQPEEPTALDPVLRISMIEDPRRAVYLYVSPDPSQWGTPLGDTRILDPRQVLHA